jgi:hypothetical protein
MLACLQIDAQFSGVIGKLGKHELELERLHGCRTLSHTTPKCPNFPTRPETCRTRDDISFRTESNSAVVEAISFLKAAIPGALGSRAGCLAMSIGYKIMSQIRKESHTRFGTENQLNNDASNFARMLR